LVLGGDDFAGAGVGAAKLKPDGALAVVEDGTPNVKPPDAGVVVSSFFRAAKLKPVVVVAVAEVAGAGAAALPKEKPPAPIPPAAGAAADEVVSGTMC